MTTYFRKVKGLLDQFRKHTMTQKYWSKNNEANVLAQLASGIDTECLVFVLVDSLHRPSIECIEQVFCNEKVKTWMDRIVDYSTHLDSQRIRKRPVELGVLQQGMP